MAGNRMLLVSMMLAGMALGAVGCAADATQAPDEHTASTPEGLGIVNNAITISPVGGSEEVIVTGYNFTPRGRVWLQTANNAVPPVTYTSSTQADAYGRISTRFQADPGWNHVNAYDYAKMQYAVNGTTEAVFVAPKNWP